MRNHCEEQRSFMACHERHFCHGLGKNGPQKLDILIKCPAYSRPHSLTGFHRRVTSLGPHMLSIISFVCPFKKNGSNPSYPIDARYAGRTKIA